MLAATGRFLFVELVILDTTEFALLVVPLYPIRLPYNSLSVPTLLP